MKAVHGLEPHFAGEYGIVISAYGIVMSHWESGERVGGDMETRRLFASSKAQLRRGRWLQTPRIGVCVRVRRMDVRSPKIGRHQFIMITMVGGV